MKKFLFAPLFAAAGFLLAFSTGPVEAQNVKITPVGTHAGEFCARDRALIFEENGIRILYDPGRTVVGSTDPRLDPGIDLVLLSSMHGDHMGDKIQEDGECDKPGADGTGTDTFTVTFTNTAEIIAGRDAEAWVGGEMRDFLRAKVGDAGGDPSKVNVLRPGGIRSIGGIKVSTVMAVHSNGINANFLSASPFKDALLADKLTAYAGPDHGYIIQFNNGLKVYLTADTGQTSDMKFIAGKDGFYGANLAVVNMGGVFSMGPEEAAWAVDHLIKPKSVIVSHANQGSTSGGAVIADTNVDKFIKASSTQTHVPLSGEVMEFNGLGRCVAGACQPKN